MSEPKLCDHCGGDIAIRNPKWYCDHLYYPDSCDYCRRGPHQPQQDPCKHDVHGTDCFECYPTRPKQDPMSEPKKTLSYYLSWLFTQAVFAVMFVASKCRRKS